MGLGPYPDVSLAEAREAAAECRRLVRNGTDPIEHRREQRAAMARERSQSRRYFRDCAETYINTHRHAWKNKKHASQWSNTLAAHAYPKIGDLPVAEISTANILSVLEPIWLTKNETANRVRLRIEKILDWAAVKNYRSGGNPARWRGHLDHLLPKPSKVHSTRHFAAMPWKDAPDFIADLSRESCLSAKALMFTILSCTRTTEAICATVGEFDMEDRIWIIPAARMKSGREHRIPLSSQLSDLVENLIDSRIIGNDYIFPGMRQGKPISQMAMLKYLKQDLGFRDLTVHGFRSTFRDWVAETTSYPGELAEACLAHVLTNKTEAAYQRGDLLERRRKLMQAWADYLFNPASGSQSP